MGNGQLVKLTISRNAHDTWDVVRERDDGGERIVGCRDLSEAFGAVLCIFEPDGSRRKQLCMFAEPEGEGG